ncbi:DmsC/YnfH family molybdoenzyme membrane anchor subunit [Fluviibacterium sp. DFM31]|uniref:DmsC/YnfH family molybdoenzyme membrane anchor subunit n=1 Tax=Meridianimarinicoccus marinus TaxID=3231483 RepID=A0ABV3L5K4_9RHOB
MHPAPSVIAFTTLSGFGLGLLYWLGLGLPPATGWAAFLYYFLGFGLAVGGLVSSTFHLGHPERAWRALTQWRSSWLSREGCLAVAGLLLMGVFAFGAVFFGALWQPFGLLGAALCLATVWATAMIYTQLKTVPRWHQPGTPALFLALALSGGAIFAAPALAPLLLALAGAVQLWVWHTGDRRFSEAGSTMQTATGLGDSGGMRQMASPHTGSNYLLDEMVYVIGRKHARKLRGLAFLGMVVLPVLGLTISHHPVMLALVAALHLAGVGASRWLFFAQAEHVVGLYYGKR